MEKRKEFSEALKDALKSRNQVALSTIRLITAALKDRDISARGQGKAEGISDEEILSMLQSMIKQRKESSKMYREGNREDLAEQEEAEIKVIERFLPEQMDKTKAKAEIDKIIAEQGATGIKDMGKVMGELKSRFAGQLDMGKASGWVKERLLG